MESAVLRTLHPDALPSVANLLGISTGLTELLEMPEALAGNGDLNLLRGIVEYESVQTK